MKKLSLNSKVINGRDDIKGGLSFYSILMIAITAFVVASQSHAQESSVSVSGEGATQTKIEDIKPEQKPKKFGITAILEGSTDLKENGTYDSSRETSYQLFPSYQITNEVKLKSEIVFVQDLKQVEKSDFKNIPIAASYKPIPLVEDQLAITPSVSVLLPANKETRDTTSLIFGAGVAQALSFDMKKLGVPAKVTYGASARRNVQEFERTNTGSSNTQYAFANYLLGEVDLGKNFSFSTKGTAFSSLTYNETWRSKFEIFEEIGYQVSESFSVAVGHANSGNTLKSDMSTSNIEVFNNNTSSIYLDLGVTY